MDEEYLYTLKIMSKKDIILSSSKRSLVMKGRGWGSTYKFWWFLFYFIFGGNINCTGGEEEES